MKIEVVLLSEFGFTFGSNFTSAVRSAFRNLFEFSVRNTKAMGSDWKLLASWYKNESTVRDTMGVKIFDITDTERSEFCGRQIFRPGGASPSARFCGVISKNLSKFIDIIWYKKTKCLTRFSVFFSLFLGYTNLYDLFFRAPCVNLSVWIKIRASRCLFSIKKLVLNPTNAISTAGALCWPIFGGLNCQFRGICSNRELDCFNDFPICQWKSPRSKVTLVLTVRSPIFGGFGGCLTFSQSHPLSSANCSCGFQVKDFKTSLCPFSGTDQNFSKFLLWISYICGSTGAHFQGLCITETVSKELL